MRRASEFLCRRFVASTSGLAAIEFAVIMPILLLLLLGTFDAGRAISAYMKTRSAAYTLAAITNQYTRIVPIQSTDMQAITGATAAVLSPFPTSAATVTITQIKQTSATQAVVSWSYSMNGAAYGAGSTWSRIPANLSSTPACASSSSNNSSYPCYFIFSEVTYVYTPSFGYFAVGSLTFSDSLYTTPRSDVCIPYVPVTGTTC
jgi:Flp pilus assembly protein TadG